MALDSLAGLNFGALTGSNRTNFGVAGTQQRTTGAQEGIDRISMQQNDPRGSLFNGFDVSGWTGSPVYEPGERLLDFNA